MYPGYTVVDFMYTQLADCTCSENFLTGTDVGLPQNGQLVVVYMRHTTKMTIIDIDAVQLSLVPRPSHVFQCAHACLSTLHIEKHGMAWVRG